MMLGVLVKLTGAERSDDKQIMLHSHIDHDCICAIKYFFVLEPNALSLH